MIKDASAYVMFFSVIKLTPKLAISLTILVGAALINGPQLV
jgi:hypothetical protein